MILSHNKIKFVCLKINKISGSVRSKTRIFESDTNF